MTWLMIYGIIKFWLPIITLLGLIIKGFRIASQRVSDWANTLLDNHMKHIQDAAEKAAGAVVELSAYHRNNIDLQKNLVAEFSTMSHSLNTFCRDFTVMQQQVLTGIEVLKDRD